MEAYVLGTRLGKALHIVLRMHDHQMDIQRLPGQLSYGFHHRKPKGNIGHESAVHNVQMEEIGILIHHFHIFLQMQKIGR